MSDLLSDEDKKFLEQLIEKAVQEIRYPVGSKHAINRGSVVAVGAASVVVQEVNDRRFVSTVMNDGANPVYISFGEAAIVGVGLTLPPLGVVIYGRGTDIPYTGKVTAFSVLGTNLICTEVNIEE